MQDTQPATALGVIPVSGRLCRLVWADRARGGAGADYDFDAVSGPVCRRPSIWLA